MFKLIKNDKRNLSALLLTLALVGCGGGGSDSGSNSLPDQADAIGIALFLFSGSYTIPSVNCSGSIRLDFNSQSETNNLTSNVTRFGCVPLESASVTESSVVSGSVSNEVVTLTDNDGANYGLNYADTNGVHTLNGTVTELGIVANISVTQQRP